MTATLRQETSPIPTPSTGALPDIDVHRIAELAQTLWWLPVAYRITAPAELDPCSRCPEPELGEDPIRADAVVCHRTHVDGFVYREPVCPSCLTAMVRARLRGPNPCVWVELPAVTL